MSSMRRVGLPAEGHVVDPASPGLAEIVTGGKAAVGGSQPVAAPGASLMNSPAFLATPFFGCQAAGLLQPLDPLQQFLRGVGYLFGGRASAPEFATMVSMTAVFAFSKPSTSASDALTTSTTLTTPPTPSPRSLHHLPRTG